MAFFKQTTGILKVYVNTKFQVLQVESKSKGFFLKMAAAEIKKFSPFRVSSKDSQKKCFSITSYVTAAFSP